MNYAVYRAQIQGLVNSQSFASTRCRSTPIRPFGWGYVRLREPFHTLQDYNNYLSQMNDIPRFFNEETVNMRAGLQRGFTPPQVTLVGRDSSIASVANAKTPEETIFYEPFKKMPATIPADEQAKLRAEGAALIRERSCRPSPNCSSLYATNTFPTRARPGGGGPAGRQSILPVARS